MANETDPLASNAGTLLTLLGLFNPTTQTQTDQGGTSTITGGGTVSGSGSSSGGYGYEQTILTQDAVNRLLQQIMESNTGLTSIAQGQKNAGLYNSSTMQMLINDLMARAAGEVAVKGAKTEKVTPVSSSSSFSRPASDTVTTTKTPSTLTTSKQPMLGGGTSSLATLLALGSLVNNKKVRELVGGVKDVFSSDSSTSGNGGNLSWASLTSNPSFDNLMTSLGITSTPDVAGNLSFSPNIVENPIIGQLLGDNTDTVNSLFGIGPVADFGQSLSAADSLGILLDDNLSTLGSIDMPFANVGDLGELDGGVINVDVGNTPDIPDNVDIPDTSGADSLGDFPYGSLVGGVAGGLANDGNLSVDEARATAINTVGNYFTGGIYGVANTLTGGEITNTLAPVVQGAEDVGFNILAATDPAFSFLNDSFNITDRFFGIDTSSGRGILESVADPLGLFGDDGGCFITTAVCEVMGYADNCHVLSTLRQFRDTWLTDNHPDEISTYYTTAPSIVEKLGKMVDKEALYGMFYTKYLLPAVRFIEHGEYEAAYETYKRLYQLTVDLTKEA